MTGLREKVARSIAAADWRCRIDEYAEPERWAKAADAYDLTNNNGRFRYDTVADAAIAACMEEAAPLVEQAFRHGIGYAQNVKVDDVDLAWETSRVRAALRALRGEGGVDAPSS